MLQDKNLGLYLLPLSQEELLALSAIIAAALLGIDTMDYQNEAQRDLMQVQRKHLESVQNKIKLRR